MIEVLTLTAEVISNELQRIILTANEGAYSATDILVTVRDDLSGVDVLFSKAGANLESHIVSVEIDRKSSSVQTVKDKNFVLDFKKLAPAFLGFRASDIATHMIRSLLEAGIFNVDSIEMGSCKDGCCEVSVSSWFTKGVYTVRVKFDSLDCGVQKIRWAKSVCQSLGSAGFNAGFPSVSEDGAKVSVIGTDSEGYRHYLTVKADEWTVNAHLKSSGLRKKTGERWSEGAPCPYLLMVATETSKSFAEIDWASPASSFAKKFNAEQMELARCYDLDESTVEAKVVIGIAKKWPDYQFDVEMSIDPKLQTALAEKKAAEKRRTDRQLYEALSDKIELLDILGFSSITMNCEKTCVSFSFIDADGREHYVELFAGRGSRVNTVLDSDYLDALDKCLTAYASFNWGDLWTSISESLHPCSYKMEAAPSLSCVIDDYRRLVFRFKVDEDRIASATKALIKESLEPLHEAGFRDVSYKNDGNRGFHVQAADCDGGSYNLSCEVSFNETALWSAGGEKSLGNLGPSIRLPHMGKALDVLVSAFLKIDWDNPKKSDFKSITHNSPYISKTGLFAVKARYPEVDMGYHFGLMTFELRIRMDKRAYCVLESKKQAAEEARVQETREAERKTREIEAMRRRVDSVNASKIDELNGLEFEILCSSVLKNNGYENVEITKGSGDQGIDVLATKDFIKYGFQCKCHSADIGNKAVQEAFAGKTYYDCHVAVVLTNRYFTPAAKELAAQTGVVLWDRDKLLSMMA